MQVAGAPHRRHGECADADAAAQDFAAASGLADVLGALKLSEAVHAHCLASAVHWFEDIGVRKPAP